MDYNHTMTMIPPVVVGSSSCWRTRSLCTVFQTTRSSFLNLTPETTLKVTTLSFSVWFFFHFLVLLLPFHGIDLCLAGICDLCPSLEKQLLVFPGHKCGSLQLVVSFELWKDVQFWLNCSANNIRLFASFSFRTCPTPNLARRLHLLPSTPTRARSPA